MWETNSLWFEVALVSVLFALGNILLGHFEVHTPRVRKLVKYLFTLALIVSLSAFVSRTVALSVYGLLFLPIFYIHLIALPRRGINGWTGEPKEHYYKLRGWSEEAN